MFLINIKSIHHHGKMLAFAIVILLLAVAGQQAMASPTGHPIDPMDPQGWDFNGSASPEVDTATTQHKTALSTDPLPGLRQADPQAWNINPRARVVITVTHTAIPCFTGRLDRTNQQALEACAH